MNIFYQMRFPCWIYFQIWWRQHLFNRLSQSFLLYSITFRMIIVDLLLSWILYEIFNSYRLSQIVFFFKGSNSYNWSLMIFVFSSYIYTVKSFCESTNKLIEIFQWIMIIMIPFVANAAFICWFAMNCLVLIRGISY